MTFFNLPGIRTSFLFRVICIFFSISFFIRAESFAQNADDLSNVKIEELSDEQIRRFAVEADRMGIKDDQIEQVALQRGMNPVEVVKLKERIQYIRKAMPVENKSLPDVSQKSNRETDSIGILEKKPLAGFDAVFAELKSKNFGFSVFNNPRLSFEPNLRLPTPSNYLLAADDELVIDVSGYSEANYKLRVSPEGIIRIPLAGPVSVNGLTIEAARKLIIRKLSSTIYSGIKSGNTFVDVNLGSVRSIKVSVIGEATLPGTYTLPSVASAYHALYACGGPNLNGSFRNIQVIRNNAVISTIDVYDYLVNGTKKNDIRLMDQDVIRINNYSVRIELKGEVKKPGLYDVAKGETLQKIIQYAGGFTDNAYTARIQVFKNTSRDRQLTTIAEQEISKAIPHKGDTYVISKILNRFTNRIRINGAVYRPGDYELHEGMTLSQLISEADGIREDAFTTRGTIHRLNDDLSPAIISFDVESILNGKMKDIPLRREDRVIIFSKFDLKEGYYVRIDGEVSSPGTFLFEEGITVQDLILMAGGLKESAFLKRVEISRRVKGADSVSANSKMAIIYQQDIYADLKDTSVLASYTLSPFDEVSIRPAPGYFTQRNVVVEGEILYSGKYTLEAKSDRISDLIKRAGGLTPQAYLEGAVLVRSRNFTRSEQNNKEQGMSSLVKQNQSGTSTAIVQNEYMDALRRKSDNVGIDLPRIIENPGSAYDLFLNDGDTLRIPKQLQTVRVNGEVLYPTLVRYEDGYKFKDYITGAGGFNERSLKKRSYVVNANGSAKGTRSFLFFRNYPRVTPGSEIYVPIKKERERLRTGEWITIGATTLSLIAILFNSLHK